MTVMEEIKTVDTEIENLKTILDFLTRNKIGWRNKKARKKLGIFLNSLQQIKINLLQIKQKLTNIGTGAETEAVEKINDICFLVDELHPKIKDMTRRLIEEELDRLRRTFATVKGLLPSTLELHPHVLEVLDKVPPDIKEELRLLFDEILKCYSARAYRATIVFCGTVLEVGLGRKYFEKKKESDPNIDPESVENELENLTIGQIINRCRDAQVIEEYPGLEEVSRLINKVRRPSIHHKKHLFKPGIDDMRTVFYAVISAIKKLYP